MSYHFLSRGSVGRQPGQRRQRAIIAFGDRFFYHCRLGGTVNKLQNSSVLEFQAAIRNRIRRSIDIARRLHGVELQEKRVYVPLVPFSQKRLLFTVHFSKGNAI
ncbi:hypothetical protein CEXT_765551 [Caerostris extrusa]|uniref:Uncharacterized protein n=1 Tax=Caerostris extrusa TaxID=172846 RepID=A0AAV4XXI4_CAEEX|nr:hypothetical protein CEXT_765551 [Caerostris extrusa]